MGAERLSRSDSDSARPGQVTLPSKSFVDNFPVCPPQKTPPFKRKRTTAPEDEAASTSKKRTKKSVEAEEKRLSRYRTKPSLDFKTILQRAETQRMFVIDRKRTGTTNNPEETIEIAGSTGNLYTVVVSKIPSCTCPHARAGNHCKHIVYVLAKTLKAPYNLQYQVALLSNEIKDIFDHAPPLPSEAASPDDMNGVRKPIEDDCPICCVEFDETNDDVVFCKAACGNNIHKDCFKQWAMQKKSQDATVTCPFCRTKWEADEDMLGKIDKSVGRINADGYVNVASQLGISGYRDTSTYHQPWVRVQRTDGGLTDEDPDTRRSYAQYSRYHDD